MEEKMKEVICAAIDRENAKLRAVSLDIWNHPELCFEEHHAHKVLTDYLTGHGFEVVKHYKLETAFRATFSNADNVGDKNHVRVGVMCEYDALPGIGHACGHNLIAILGLAIAVGIKEAMQLCGLKGTLTVLGTPAEEGGGGKIDLINAGAYDDLDIAMMAHPSQTNLTRPIYVAFAGVDVDYHGKASHAASFPWAGINALDAAVLCYQNVSCMRQHMKPSWRVHGIITDGGLKPNIIPAKASLQFYARAPTTKELEELKTKLVGCMEGAATASGCQVSYRWAAKPYQSLLSNPTMASMYQRHGESLGIRFESDPVKLLKQGGSTDMGNVSHVLPSIHPKYGLTPQIPAHSEEFRELAKTEASHATTILHAKALALMGSEVMANPSVCQAIKDKFQMSRAADD